MLEVSVTLFIITALVSPDDLYRACLECEKLNLSFHYRKFDSGLKVMQSVSYSDDAVCSNLLGMLNEVGMISAVGLAKKNNSAVMVAREQLMV